MCYFVLYHSLLLSLFLMRMESLVACVILQLIQTQIPELYGSSHWLGMGSVFSRTKFMQISTSKEKPKNIFDVELSDLREDLWIPKGAPQKEMLILVGSGSVEGPLQESGEEWPWKHPVCISRISKVAQPLLHFLYIGGLKALSSEKRVLVQCRWNLSLVASNRTLHTEVWMCKSFL